MKFDKKIIMLSALVITEICINTYATFILLPSTTIFSN
jgi:hypothetical protein